LNSTVFVHLKTARLSMSSVYGQNDSFVRQDVSTLANDVKL